MTRYRSKPTTIDKYRFASQLESQRYLYLRQCEADDLIHDLVADKRELRFVFHEGGREIPSALRPAQRKIRALYYEADFRYTVPLNGERYIVWEDVKGETGRKGKRKPFMTPLARFKITSFRLEHLHDEYTILRICTRPNLDPRCRDGYYY